MSSDVLIGKVRKGSRYGYLVAAGAVDVVGDRKKIECICDCGAKAIVYSYSLTSGNTKSCGCRRGKAERKDGHGMARTKEYRSWSHMKNRCMNPRNNSFRYYGKRGISVCDRWLSFKNFFEDMGLAPSKDHSIDRIDNNGNYCPENCRWATIKEQRRNKRDNRLLTINGETKTLAEWVESVGGHYKTAHNRQVMGWSPEDAIYGKERAGDV